MAAKYREEWLNAAVTELAATLFTDNELFGEGSNKPRMPDKWQVTCGWSKGANTRTLGVCVDPKCSKDGTTHLFIIPTEDKPLAILSTLVHEMIHAMVGIKEGHRGLFSDMCTKMGMSKPWTASGVQEDTIANDYVLKVAEKLGPYPHAAIMPVRKLTKPTEWIRFRSVVHPKYRVVVNRQMVIKHGLPRDPFGREMVPLRPENFFKTEPRIKVTANEQPVETQDDRVGPATSPGSVPVV